MPTCPRRMPSSLPSPTGRRPTSCPGWWPAARRSSTWARLPAARPGRLPALVRVHPSPPGAPRRGGLRPAGASPGRAHRPPRRAGPDRRRAGLLPDGHPPRPRAAGPGRADRRPGRRRQERRLGRRARAQAGPPFRRGQRERPGLRARRSSPRGRDRAGAGRRRPAGGLGRDANPGAVAVDFVPHLVPMNRGILSTCHVRPTRPVDRSRARRAVRRGLRRRAVRRGRRGLTGHPPRARQQLRPGPRPARRAERPDPRDRRRSTTWSRARPGQGIQAFNLVHGLPETAGLEQLPIAP